MNRTYRVLSISGGGMRGVYAAAYLSHLGDLFATSRGRPQAVFGSAFDMLIGTSTGAIVACALAVRVPLSHIVTLYSDYGRHIFRLPLPDNRRAVIKESWWSLGRRRQTELKRGDDILRHVLRQQFGETTLGEVFARHGVALEIPAVDMGNHGVRVFKTPHRYDRKTRDSDYTLVDVCMAATAAPLYRSLAAIKAPNGQTEIFADGGLYANNPIMIGLIDAMMSTEPDRPIELVSLGTCRPPPGERITVDQVHRSLMGWRFGGGAAELSIDAQDDLLEHMPAQLARGLERCGIRAPYKVVTLPYSRVPPWKIPFLRLDATSNEAVDALIDQARRDAQSALDMCDNPEESDAGAVLRGVLMDATNADNKRQPMTPDGATHESV